MILRPRTVSAALALLVVLTTGGLTGCGNDEPGAGSSADSSSAADSPTTESGDGTQEVSTDQVRLRLPEGWKTLDGAEALKEGGEKNPVMTTLAERLGVPREQLVKTMESIDLFAVADGGARGGILTNVNVLHHSGSLPNEAQFALQVAHFADSSGDVTTVDSAVGDVLRTDYALDINGLQAQFEVLLTQVGDDLVTITITAADADDAAEVADLVVDSLQEA